MHTKHTPGPWSINDHHGKRYIEPTFEDSAIATIHKIGSGPRLAQEYEANGKLIAGAPALLAAAIKVLNGLNERIDSATENRTATPVFDGIADLHDAINKATA